MEHAIYPFDEMKITQRHDEGNHLAHWSPMKQYADKPWDEACKDAGRSYFIPGNDYVVEQVLGAGTDITNTVRLRSLNKVKIPFCEELVYLYITLTHMEESDIVNLKPGDIIRKGERRLLEGMDGQATGNHFHITANIGKYYGLLKNGNGKWCYTYEKSLLPDEAFYIDKEKTTVYNANGYNFIEVPKNTEPVQVPVEPKKEEFAQFEATLKQGSQLYNANGGTYNKALTDKSVRVLSEENGRYKVYCQYFRPNEVYVDKGSIVAKNSIYPFNATIKIGSKLYNQSGYKYPGDCKANRSVIVQGEAGDRYRIYCDAFNPKVVYCDRNSIIR